MDPSRFDALTRAFAAAATRRRALGALAALAVAPLAADAKPTPNAPEPAACLANGKRCSLPASASADHGKGKHGGKGGKGKHHPPSCSKCCSRYGAAGTDGKARCACKGEGEACANPSQCCGGLCKNGHCTACPDGLTACAGNCVDLQTNDQHCGACTNACASGQRCVGGHCVCDGTSCPRGCCAQDGSCQRGTSDQACGIDGADCQTCATCTTCDGTTCRNAVACCGDASVCQSGTCQDCAAGQRCKGGQCVCDATSCPDGCCSGTTCVPIAQQTDQQCGTGGAACQGCTGNDTCGGGGTDGVCGCTASCADKCAGAANGCDGVCPDDRGCVGCCDAATRTCGPCPTGAACDVDGACQRGQCINHACGSYCPPGSLYGAGCGVGPDNVACQCLSTAEGQLACAGFANCEQPACKGSGDCPSRSFCWHAPFGMVCQPLCNVDPGAVCS